MTSSVYRGHKAIMKQTEETMKTNIVVPPHILHWTYDDYLFAVVKFFLISLAHFLNMKKIQYIDKSRQKSWRSGRFAIET